MAWTWCVEDVLERQMFSLQEALKEVRSKSSAFSLMTLPRGQSESAAVPDDVYAIRMATAVRCVRRQPILRHVSCR